MSSESLNNQAESQVVCLDQLHWIALSRAMHGKDAGQRLELAQAALAAVQSGRVRFPLSEVNLLEFQKIGDPGRRTRLAQTFVTFGQGWVWAPWQTILLHEVSALVNGTPIPKGHALQRGFLLAFGPYAEIAPPLGVSPSEMELLDRESDTPRAWLAALTSLSKKQQVGQARSLASIADRQVHLIESVRSQWRARPENEKLGLYAAGVLLDLKEANLGTEVSRYLDRIESLNGSSLIEALAALPSLDVLVRLGFEKAKQWDRPSAPNDLWDLALLSTAIPYCNAVVTEKLWSHLAKKSGLCAKYDTLVAGNLEKLGPLLTATDS